MYVTKLRNAMTLAVALSVCTIPLNFLYKLFIFSIAFKIRNSKRFAKRNCVATVLLNDAAIALQVCSLQALIFLYLLDYSLSVSTNFVNYFISRLRA